MLNARSLQAKPWTEEEERWLRATVLTHTMEQQAAYLGRTTNSIRGARKRFNLVHRTAPREGQPRKRGHDLCPGCGNRKLAASTTCRACANAARNRAMAAARRVERPAPAQPPTPPPLPGDLAGLVAAIGQQPPRQLLTAAEEQALGQALAVPALADEARRILVERNTRMVWSLALRYMTPGVSNEDLYQEGMVGLLYALTKWEPERGLKLSTYATNWIAQHIRRYLDERVREIRLPCHVEEKRRKIHNVGGRLTATLGRQPTDEELAEATGYATSQIAAVRLAETRTEICSLEFELGEGEDRERHEVIPDPSADVEGATLEALQSEELHSWLGQLPARERRIIVLRYGLDVGAPRTLEQVGLELGVTRERVRQIERDAMQRLRAVATRAVATAAD